MDGDCFFIEGFDEGMTEYVLDNHDWEKRRTGKKQKERDQQK